MEYGTLYIVATPIGNSQDMSPRGIKVLTEVDIIAAEDTRTSGILLSSFDIHKPMISYFDHNRRAHGEKILARLKANICPFLFNSGLPFLLIFRHFPISSVSLLYASNSLSVRQTETGIYLYGVSILSSIAISRE